MVNVSGVLIWTPLTINCTRQQLKKNRLNKINLVFFASAVIIFFFLFIALPVNKVLEKSVKTGQVKNQQHNKQTNTVSIDIATAKNRGYQTYSNLSSRTTFNRGDLGGFFSKEVINEIPEDRINLEISKVYSDNGYYDTATEILERELSYSPCNTELQTEIGKIYCSQKKQENLHRMASTIIARCEDNTSIYTNLSHILNECNDFEQGKKILEDGIKTNPTEVHLRYVLGDYLMAKGMFQESEEEFLKAIEYNKNEAAGYFNLGELYEKTGRNELAQAYYSAAVQISPDYAEMVQELTTTARGGGLKIES